jgi:Family of unknown function (DUF5675)
MRLVRDNYRPDGVFSHLLADDGTVLASTLEHSYQQPNGSWLAKIVPGTYTCQRRLSPHFGFDVFQVMNVPNCDFIEIHPGNFDKNSEGCILLGEAVLIQPSGAWMITNSRATFDKFMGGLAGTDTFTLVVE